MRTEKLKSVIYKTFFFILKSQNDWPDGYRLAASIHFRYPDCVRVPLNSIVSRCSQSGLDLLEDLLLYDPDKRPTAQQSLKYPYFNVMKRISPAAATKANVKLTAKYGNNSNVAQNLSNNVLPVQEKLQTLTELLQRSNSNNNVNQITNNNNISHTDSSAANLDNSKNGHILVQQAKNVSQIPKISFLTMNSNDLINNKSQSKFQQKSLNESGSVKSETIRYNTILAPSSNIYLSTGNLNQSSENLTRTESINDIFLNRNISQLFGLTQTPAATMQSQRPNVSFHNGNVMGSNNRGTNAIYVNGSRNYALYETAAKNAKNSAKIGGYYVYTRPNQDFGLNDSSKVYNMFSKVELKQNVPAELIVRHAYEPNLMGSKVYANNDHLSARSQIGRYESKAHERENDHDKLFTNENQSRLTENDDELDTILG